MATNGQSGNGGPDAGGFERRELGGTGLALTTLGLGCAAMAGNHRPVADEDIAGAIDEGLASGIGFVDTAPFYGFGRSERFVGNALRSAGFGTSGRAAPDGGTSGADGDESVPTGADPDGTGLVLSTKAGRLLRPGAAPEEDARDWPGALPFTPVYDYSYAGVMRSFEDSFQRLGLPRIDILLLHDIGEMQHGAEANRALFDEAMTGGYRALDELRRAGDIRGIGLGVNEREVCLAAMERGDWDCFLLAGRYTLLEQAPLDDLFPACEKAGTGIILGGPYNSGILVGGSTWNYAEAPPDVIERVRRIEAVCTAHGVPLPAAALQFPLGSALVASVIPGPRSRAEARQNLEWFRADIPASLWSDLANEGLLHEAAPRPGASS